MTLYAPMVGKITRTIFNHANPNIIELLRAPMSRSRFAFVFGGNYLRPIGCSKRDISHVHIITTTVSKQIGGYAGRG